MYLEPLEHPDITKVREYGLPEAPTLVCPVCKQEDPDTIYHDREGEIVGCDLCITISDAVDTPACYPEEEY